MLARTYYQSHRPRPAMTLAAPIRGCYTCKQGRKKPNKKDKSRSLGRATVTKCFPSPLYLRKHFVALPVRDLHLYDVIKYQTSGLGCRLAAFF